MIKRMLQIRYTINMTFYTIFSYSHIYFEINYENNQCFFKFTIIYYAHIYKLHLT